MPVGSCAGPVVSVVMVAQDCRSTVRRAVESIQNQTHRAYELVVVDAGSTDGTARMLDSLADRDVRMSVVHSASRDRRAAMNLAIARATGTYLLLLDADGWCEAPMLASLVSMAEAGNLELVVSGLTLSVRRPDSDREASVTLSAPTHVYPTQHDFRSDAWRLFDDSVLLPVGAKLYRLDRIQRLGLSFGGHAVNGHDFVVDYLQDVERVGILADVRYHVVRMVGSPQWLDGGFRDLEDEHACLSELYAHWGMGGDAASMEMLQRRYLERLVSCIELVSASRNGLTADERTSIVASMIDNDQAKLAASVVRPRDVLSRAMLSTIRQGNARLAYGQARLASLFMRPQDRLTPDEVV